MKDTMLICVGALCDCTGERFDCMCVAEQDGDAFRCHVCLAPMVRIDTDTGELVPREDA